MTYEAFRHFADSWGLLFLILLFVVALALAFRPGSRARQDDARMIPFRDDEVGR
jgi:cytochrome c oxidase cbb3-type subunit 4